METYKIFRVVSNNLVRAQDQNGNEVILTGKGIGFNAHRNDLISSARVENIFVLKDEREADLYNQLIENNSARLLEIVNACIIYIQSNFDKPLNDHIHVALSDHIAFLVKRYKLGIPIENPFGYETDVMYPKESMVAKQVVQMLNQQLHLDIPEGEASFIALHIISSLSDSSIMDLQKSTQLIGQVMKVLQKHLNIEIDKSSLNYARLLTHLRFMLKRLTDHEELQIPKEMEVVLKQQYPVCYNLAWKMCKIIQNKLQAPVAENEIVCLSLHLYRFTKNENENSLISFA